LEIYSFETLASTQTHLCEQIESHTLAPPIAIIASNQYAGIGSRDNKWSGEEGNFFASFALEVKMLPSDLPLASASIYFSFIMKQTLVEMGEKIWLKWPNDFYLGDKKVGGTITQKVNNILVCGIGINLKKREDGYSALETTFSPKLLLENYLFRLEKFPTWKHIFSEYEIEFELSKKFSAHIKGYQESLEDARLCKDGSLIIGGKKVFSLR